MELALKEKDGDWLFPRYIEDGKCKVDHASASINKWLKKDFSGLTAHCEPRYTGGTFYLWLLQTERDPSN
jgi:hypothetical protein